MTGYVLLGVVGLAGISLGGAGPTVGAFVGSFVASLTKDHAWARPFGRRLARIERALGIESDAGADAGDGASGDRR